MATITRKVSGATINGTAGADVITVTGNNDVINGLAGNDQIKATGTGNSAFGGGGTDAITMSAGGSADTAARSATTKADGGAGADTIIASSAVHSTQEIGTVKAENSLVGGLGNDKITGTAEAGGGGDVNVTAFNNISGGGGANILTGMAEAHGDALTVTAKNTLKGGELATSSLARPTSKRRPRAMPSIVCSALPAMTSSPPPPHPALMGSL